MLGPFGGVRIVRIDHSRADYFAVFVVWEGGFASPQKM
jgi:hypothetical protein